MMSKKLAVVLLVEDEQAHAEIVRRCFGDFPVARELVHVDNGKAALDYLYRRGAYVDPEKSPRPDVILLDLRIPKVDGLEVLKTIKNDPGYCEIPVVILSTSESEHDIKTAYQNHANSYLVKPFAFPEFSATMKSFGDYWLTRNVCPA